MKTQFEMGMALMKVGMYISRDRLGASKEPMATLETGLKELYQRIEELEKMVSDCEDDRK